MKKHWSRSVHMLLLILLLFAVLLLGLELWFNDETSNQFIGFYAWTSFISCLVLIVIALLLGKIIKRKEDYYER